MCFDSFMLLVVSCVLNCVSGWMLGVGCVMCCVVVVDVCSLSSGNSMLLMLWKWFILVSVNGGWLWLCFSVIECCE